MNDDTLVYLPGLRTAWLRWIWGRPGPTGGWQLTLPGAATEVQPPRRGMPPEQVEAWLRDVLRTHGWQPAPPEMWLPLLPLRSGRYRPIRVLPLRAGQAPPPSGRG
ncbi:hypothetical protein ACWEJ6_48630 [Nonomuraea sp. NPDC004702]